MGDHQITINSRTLHYGKLILYGTSDFTPAHVKEAVKILSKYKEDVKKIITKLPLNHFTQGVQGILKKKYAKVELIP